MSYKNIVFVKLMWKELLHEDDRFIGQLNDSQKGLYLMLLLLAGATDNNIKNDEEYLKRVLNLSENSSKIRENLDIILKVFPKLKVFNKFLKFSKFNKLHNYIRKSQEMPKCSQKDVLDKDKNRIDKDVLGGLLVCFLKTKNIPITENYYSLLARFGKPLKELYAMSNSSVEDCEGALAWAGREWNGKKFDWGVEAVCRNYHGYLASKSKPVQQSVGQDITKVKMYGM